MVLKLVESELSWSERHTHEVECGVEAGGESELSWGQRHTCEVECVVKASGAGVELE